ncbi:hypothetical protein FGIG_03851 [Fasciola gigantica]|uniref:Ephrin RBD domain-containing protein n=1 Tax=Fasciola gigantica TaxID=46835 RepID=A0A504YD65_FASGI|nr:hypothetical protein FGIG_03851 [Fasciola gigantica]
MHIGFYYIIMTVLPMLPNASELHQDHIVQWDVSNDLFKEQKNVMHVQEGDNLIFTCLKNPSHNFQLFWTTFTDVYNACNSMNKQRVRKLFECKQGKSNIDFILKVSQFSELSGAPQYLPGKPVFYVAQTPWCSEANMKLATIRETDKHMFIQGNKSLLKILKQNEPSTTNITTTKATVLHVKSPSNRDRSQLMEPSDWSNYRFLLLPGSLALLTLLGMQIVVCTFWLPKSVKRYFRCCGSRRNALPEEDEEGADLRFYRSQIKTRLVRSKCPDLSQCVSADHRFSRIDRRQTASTVTVPQCLPCGPNYFPHVHKLRNCTLRKDCLDSYSYEPVCTNYITSASLVPSANNKPATSSINSEIICTADPVNGKLICYRINPSLEPTLWIPCVQKSLESGRKIPSVKPTIRFAETSLCDAK